MLKILFSITFIALYTFAQDDSCAAGKPEPSYSTKSKGIKSYKSELKDNYLVETFTLASGEGVKIGKGGCAHFDRAITFTIPSTTEKTFDQKAWLDKALVLLKKLPKESTVGKPATVADEIASQVTSERKKLEKVDVHHDGKEHRFEATDDDIYDTVRVEIVEKEKTVELTVGVNTAL